MKYSPTNIESTSGFSFKLLYEKISDRQRLPKQVNVVDNTFLLFGSINNYPSLYFTKSVRNVRSKRLS